MFKYEKLIKRLREDAEWVNQENARELLTASNAIEELLKAGKAMHAWMFFNSGDEKAAFDECGLSDEMNAELGYCGQLVAETPSKMGDYVDLDMPLELMTLHGDAYKPYSSTLRDFFDKNGLPYKVANVRPVVRGKWEEDCTGAAICSVCGEYAFETSTHHLCGWFPNFCPNCGADMREGEE